METNKLKHSGILGTASRHAGALAGAVVVTGKKIGLCVKNVITTEQEPAEQIKKSPVQVQAKKKKIATKTKTVKKKKKRKAKTTKVKKKTKTPKRTSRPGSRIPPKTKTTVPKVKSTKTTASTDSVS
ncbi:MAG: hypothetical protein ACYS1A_09825 [Planctomycetota bacterium]|jgi:hypothetical protein